MGSSSECICVKCLPLLGDDPTGKEAGAMILPSLPMLHLIDLRRQKEQAASSSSSAAPTATPLKRCNAMTRKPPTAVFEQATVDVDAHDITEPQYRGYILTDLDGYDANDIRLAENTLYRINNFDPDESAFVCARTVAQLFEWCFDGEHDDSRVFEVLFGGDISSDSSRLYCSAIQVVRELSTLEMAGWLSGPFVFGVEECLQSYPERIRELFKNYVSVDLELGVLHSETHPALQTTRWNNKKLSTYYALRGELYSIAEEPVWKKDRKRMRKYDEENPVPMTTAERFGGACMRQNRFQRTPPAEDKPNELSDNEAETPAKRPRTEI